MSGENSLPNCFIRTLENLIGIVVNKSVWYIYSIKMSNPAPNVNTNSTRSSKVSLDSNYGLLINVGYSNPSPPTILYVKTATLIPLNLLTLPLSLLSINEQQPICLHNKYTANLKYTILHLYFNQRMFSWCWSSIHNCGGETICCTSIRSRKCIRNCTPPI
jgi:hypothetical protein